MIHPEQTGRWLTHILKEAHEARTDPSCSAAERSQILAFAYGHLTHAAGDMWAHTLVDDAAGGVFPSVGELADIGDATEGHDGDKARGPVSGEVDEDGSCRPRSPRSRSTPTNRSRRRSRRSIVVQTAKLLLLDGNVMTTQLSGSLPWLRSIDSDHSWRSDGRPRVCKAGAADCPSDGAQPRPAEHAAGNDTFPLWESCLLRPTFATLYRDWENGSAQFPALGDAPSADPSDRTRPPARPAGRSRASSRTRRCTRSSITSRPSAASRSTWPPRT